MSLGWEGAISNFGAVLTWFKACSQARRLAGHGLGNLAFVPPIRIIGRLVQMASKPSVK
jgi:hypothetical protein